MNRAGWSGLSRSSSAVYCRRARGATKQRAWVKSIPDAKTVGATTRRRVGTDEFGKFIIDVKTNDIYFIDVNLFNIHADFVLGVLLKQPWTARERPRVQQELRAREAAASSSAT